jgi:hypothetical protein
MVSSSATVTSSVSEVLSSGPSKESVSEAVSMSPVVAEILIDTVLPVLDDGDPAPPCGAAA